VGDVNLAARFYAALLLKEGERVSPGRHYFNLEGTILVCYDPKADEDDDLPGWKPHFNQYLYIATVDLEGTFQRFKILLHTGLSGSIELMPWGERLFYANDPWGNPICFVDEKSIFVAG
jgi:hypothetical protein